MFTILSLLGSLIEITLFILAIATVYYILRYLWELIPLDNLKKRAVFITGCDSGFGHGIALKCAKNGIPVFAGCYTEEVNVV
jgi:3-hydroxybutyrate dehydrogenase